MSDYQITLVSIAFAVAFIVASARARAGLVLLSFCFNALGRLDVGITFDLTKICALLGWGVLLFRPRRRASLLRPTDSEGSLGKWLFRCFGPFLFYACAVWTIGYFLVPKGVFAIGGWARGSQGKPIVQLISVFSMMSFVPIVAMGLKTEEDVRWFIRRWVAVGLLAAVIGFIQVGWHQATGSTLWGIRRNAEIVNQLAIVNIAGRSFQRANGFVGEPKILGMLLGISFMVLISSYSHKLELWTHKQVFLYSVVLLLGILVTFSSGAWLVLILLASYLYVIRAPEIWRVRIIIVGCVLVGLLAGATFWQAAYETRLVKVYDVVHSVIDPDAYRGQSLWGDAKEGPSLMYLLRNPQIAISGVGLGTAPFYYESLMKARFRGLYQEPNSGLTWALYSFGLIGIGLFFVGLRRAMRSSGMVKPWESFSAMLFTCVAIYFIPNNPIEYVWVILGLVGSEGVRAPRIFPTMPGNAFSFSAGSTPRKALTSCSVPGQASRNRFPTGNYALRDRIQALTRKV